MNKIIQKINKRWKEVNSMAGVGIDPDVNKIPKEIWKEVGGKKNIGEGFFLFNKKIIDATHKYVVDYKINSNFFQGEEGRFALKKTFNYLKKRYPNIIRIYDGKFADIGNTAEKIAEEVFGNLDADAVLLNPYMGVDAIEPFTKWKDKLVILCVNTSNPSSSEVQDLILKNNEPLWRFILKLSLSKWNNNKNIIPVLSATYPKNLIDIRKIVGDLPILLAGVGSQGGEMEKALKFCLDKNKNGVMISSSRKILYAKKQKKENYIDAAKREIINLRDLINKYR